MERESTETKARSRLRLLWLPAAIVVVSLAIVAYVSLSRIDLLEFKRAHETTATVQQKERVGEQWRVYYRIDNFNHLSEHLVNRVTQAEEARLNNVGLRFTYNSKEWYDKVEMGDTLEVTYRIREDGEIEIISIINPKHPSLH